MRKTTVSKFKERINISNEAIKTKTMNLLISELRSPF
jgi:hypothetical protein